MKKSLCKSFAALILVFAMILGTVPTTFAKITSHQSGTTVTLSDGSVYTSDMNFDVEEFTVESIPEFACYGEIIKQDENGTLRKITDPAEIAAILGEEYTPNAKSSVVIDTEAYCNETVDVIVIMDGESFAESKGVYVGDTIDAVAYNKARSKMVKQHEALAKKIAKLSACDASITANFSMTVNGFAMKVQRKYISEIKQQSGVKYAFEAPVYSVPDYEVSTNDTFNSGAEQQGTYNAWDCGYMGEGMTVAVIDTGCDIDHQAFTEPDDPRFSYEDIQALLEAYDFEAESRMPSFTADNAYISSKFPFVFDYSQNDADVNHTNGVSSHGTHVAGIVAADELDRIYDDDWDNLPGVSGIAPEAQLIIMKVFASTGASFVDIISAMEDAMLLGVDAINLSLGITAGSDYDEGITEVFDAANAAGINVVVSAGNESTSGSGNSWGYDMNLTLNPDNGVVGSPGSYASNMTVASVDSSKVFDYYGTHTLTYFYDPIWHDPNYVWYADHAPEGYRMEDVLGGQTLPMVIIENNDFESYGDLSGKFVVCFEDSETPTQEIYNMAVNAGAAAMLLVAENEDDEFAYDTEIESYERMPFVNCADWSYYDMLWIFETYNVAPEDYYFIVGETYVDNSEGSGMSYFSSWGPTLDLRLKPEISAVGGSVYSTYDGNSYADWSGTSMAAPQIAGASVIVKQYLKENYPEMTDEELHDTVNAIIMSTATQVTGRGDVDCSPRNQGAGLLNVGNAVKTNAYITVDGCDKPKLELGDDSERTGEYTLTFNVVNLGDTELNYDIDVTTLTEMAVAGTIRDGEPIYMMFGEPYALSPIVYGDTSVTVPANGTASATVTIKLSETDIAYINEHYQNGAYVDGFVKLIDKGENPINLSTPFLAFYGDWTALSAFDISFGYDCLPYLGLDDTTEGNAITDEIINYDYSSVSPHMILTSVNGKPHYLGNNFLKNLSPTIGNYGFAWNDLGCYISPNGDGVCDGIEAVYTGLLRNVTNVIYTIMDVETGEIYYQKEVGGYTKYTMDRYGNQLPLGMDEVSAFDPWYGTDAEGNTLPDGTVVYVSIECEMIYRGEDVTDNSLDSWGFLCCIDTTSPDITFDFTNEDNMPFEYVKTITISDDGNISDTLQEDYWLSNGKPWGARTIGWNPVTERGSYVSNRSCSDSVNDLAVTTLMIRDFAGNETMLVFDVRENNIWITLDCEDEVNMLVGDTMPISNVYDFGNVQMIGLITNFESGNESIVSVESTGENSAMLTANAAGNVTITAALRGFLYTVSVNINVYEREYVISSTANEGGSITESQTVETYSDAAFTITPDEGYYIADVLVDGESVGVVEEYTFENVRAAHSIEAIFAREPVEMFTVTFVDYDGTILSEQEVESGSAAIAPTVPEREHYRFTGWSHEFDCVTEDMIIVAQYELDIEIGDVNFDGEINSQDALIAMRIALNVMESYEAQLAAADVNGDMRVNAQDALMLLRYSLGVDGLPVR